MHSLALAYGALALLAVVARWLPSLGAAALALAVVALALLPTAGLWHRGAVRRLQGLHRFAPERWLGRWAAKRVPGQVFAAIVAVALTAAVVLQSPLFGAIEWTLLAAAPLVFAAVRGGALARARRLFSRGVYAVSAADGVARLVTFALLCAVWLAGRYVLAEGAGKPLADAVYELQSAWPAMGTATARWAIDAGAWGQGILATLDGASPVPWWRVAIAALFLPLTVFGHAVWSAAGATVDVAGWRRMIGVQLTDASVPPPIGRSRATAYGACLAAAIAVIVVAFAQADAALARQERLLALEALPSCERIGARTYSLGTLAKVAAYTKVLEEGMQSRRASACERIAQMRRLAEKNVDGYLDWYFSLGGDWTRAALMLAGDVESLLAVKFDRLVASDPQVVALIDGLQHDQHYLLEVASLGRNGLADLLEQQRLVLDERQCRAVTDAGSGIAVLPRYDGLRARLVASATSGVVAGAFAGALTSRAMARASMRAAGRGLGKAATRRGVSRAGSAAAGAAAGAVAGSVVPGVGTAAGIVAGAAAGIATDVAMLAVEEKLTREDMRRDLLAAVDESLATLRIAFDCPAQ
jgi:hypothetical protein